MVNKWKTGKGLSFPILIDFNSKDTEGTFRLLSNEKNVILKKMKLVDLAEVEVGLVFINPSLYYIITENYTTQGKKPAAFLQPFLGFFYPIGIPIHIYYIRFMG